jgi:hypothetical protein
MRALRRGEYGVACKFAAQGPHRIGFLNLE